MSNIQSVRVVRDKVDTKMIDNFLSDTALAVFTDTFTRVAVCFDDTEIWL